MNWTLAIIGWLLLGAAALAVDLKRGDGSSMRQTHLQNGTLALFFGCLLVLLFGACIVIVCYFNLIVRLVRYLIRRRKTL